MKKASDHCRRAKSSVHPIDFRKVLRLDHRQPKLKMLGVQCNVTYAMLHNYTNVTPALQHMEVLCYNGLNL